MREPLDHTIGGVAAGVKIVPRHPAGTVEGPAWTATLDFGSAVLPHHLVARALAKDGGEVGRAEQWVNLPRPPAEVQILPEAAGQGPPTSVRLNWASRTGERPSPPRL